MRRHRIQTVLACVSLAGVCGCHGGERPTTYPGPRRPSDEVATLTSAAYIEILGVDSHPYSAREVEILPGAHRVEFKVTFRAAELGGPFANQANEHIRSTCYADARFIAEPGVDYRLVKLSKRRGEAFSIKDRAYMVDHEFGVLLVDKQLGDVIPEAVSDMNCD